MALSQAANLVERVLGHDDNAVTEQNMTNPSKDREKYGDPSGEKMKALAWMGKGSVKLGSSSTEPEEFFRLPALFEAH